MYEDDENKNPLKDGGLRQYSGAQTNRIDVVAAVSNNFRVQGVPSHFQQTTVYIKDDVQFVRRRQQSADEPQGDGSFQEGNNPIDKWSEIYRFPNYPYNLPKKPREGELCPDPRDVEELNTVEFRRWPLNRTFDNVEWRAENSTDSFKCNVLDTIEIQPYLCHNE